MTWSMVWMLLVAGDDLAVLEVHRERQPREVGGLRQGPDDAPHGLVEGHVPERHVRVVGRERLHDVVHGQAHRAHAAAADHDVLIAVQGVLEGLLRLDVLQSGLQHNVLSSRRAVQLPPHMQTIPYAVTGMLRKSRADTCGAICQCPTTTSPLFAAVMAVQAVDVNLA